MAARWIYHAHECALGYRRINSGVDDRKQKEACHRILHPRRGARRPSASGGFTASFDEVSKEAWTVDESKRDRLKPSSSKSCEGSRSAGDEASEEQFATHLDTVQHTRQTAGTKRGAEDDVMVSAAKRAHTIPFPLTLALLLSATGWKPILIPGDAMRISTQCEEHVRRPDVKVGFDAAGSPRITGTDDETTRIEKTAVLARRHKSKKPSTERIIHTNVLNRSKRNQVRSRIETRDNTVGVSAPERYVSAQACRMMMEDRAHQLVSYDVSAVSFRAWLERDARVKPPKDFRLSDDWPRCAMKAFLLLSPDASRKSAILRRDLRN